MAWLVLSSSTTTTSRSRPSIPASHRSRPSWDSYILQRQRDQPSSARSSSSQSSASTWARQQDGGHRTRIHLNIFHLEASWHVATWSSASTKMSAIILPGDPADHHDLLPDILSQPITYILSINLPRVELRSHLAAALHAAPPGVAHQSQNNIRVVMHHLDQQPSPRRHHQELIQYLRYHLREHRAFVGHASFTIEDTYTLLTAACHCYIDQLPPRQPTRAIGHRAQRETSTSSSSTSSNNIEHREPHLHIGMIYMNDHQEKDHWVLTANGHQPSPRPQVVYDITGEEMTSHIEHDIENKEQEEIASTLSTHHHVPRHRVVYNIFGQPHLECLEDIPTEVWEHHWEEHPGRVASLATIMDVGITINIMKSFIGIGKKKKNIKIGSIDELIMNGT